jgi:enamine deaminase RidA (YjgF/YER057c/UK114 family)
VLGLDRVVRLTMSVAPQGRGSLASQVEEVLATMEDILERQAEKMSVTVQSVFVRSPEEVGECRRLFARHFGSLMPVTNFVPQPPCCGAALAVEAWAVGGPDAKVRYLGPNLVTVAYDGIRWIHCAGVMPSAKTAHGQSAEAFESMRGLLATVGASFDQVVRTWLYLGGITAEEDGLERYRELNRARTDFFEGIRFGGNGLASSGGSSFYPASTGIGTLGRGLVTACLALQTSRRDVRLLPLENPLQTPSYCYEKKFSMKSPKFSRAMALVLGNYVTTWVSGTASIVNSETRHPGDIERQTGQTIDNIECLISKGNFGRQGLRGAGATLADLAKVRVYIKRPEDYAKCREVCERRLGRLPTIYAFADVCRPDLLVEIEGVAFSTIKNEPVNREDSPADYLTDP